MLLHFSSTNDHNQKQCIEQPNNTMSRMCWSHFPMNKCSNITSIEKLYMQSIGVRLCQQPISGTFIVFVHFHNWFNHALLILLSLVQVKAKRTKLRFRTKQNTKVTINHQPPPPIDNFQGSSREGRSMKLCVKH